MVRIELQASNGQELPLSAESLRGLVWLAFDYTIVAGSADEILDFLSSCAVRTETVRLVPPYRTLLRLESALRDAETADDSVTADREFCRNAHFCLIGAKGYERRRHRNSDRVIAISPRLSRLLGRLSRRGVTAYGRILLDSRGKPWTANAVRCRMRRLRVKVGLGVDRRGEKVVAYTLRHTGATAAAAAGVRDFMLAEALGHASTRTTERYVHISPDQVCAAMGRVWEAKSAFARQSERPGSLRTRPD